MKISHLSILCMVTALLLALTTGCGSGGKYADLSWEETLETGKKFRNDESKPQDERFAAAEEAYQIALCKMTDALDGEQIQVGDMNELFNELDSLLRTMGEKDKLEKFLNTKVSIYARQFGRDNLMTGAAHESLGNLHMKDGRNKKAIGEFAEAMLIYKLRDRTSSADRMKERIEKLQSGSETASE